MRVAGRRLAVGPGHDQDHLDPGTASRKRLTSCESSGIPRLLGERREADGHAASAGLHHQKLDSPSSSSSSSRPRDPAPPACRSSQSGRWSSRRCARAWARSAMRRLAWPRLIEKAGSTDAAAEAAQSQDQQHVGGGSCVPSSVLDDLAAHARARISASPSRDGLSPTSMARSTGISLELDGHGRPHLPSQGPDRSRSR